MNATTKTALVIAFAIVVVLRWALATAARSH